MAEIKQNLTQEQIEKLTKHQSEISTSILNIGEAHLRLRELNNEVDRIKVLLKKFEVEFDTQNAQYNEYLNELEKIYPNGEIDLNEGVVILPE